MEKKIEPTDRLNLMPIVECIKSEQEFQDEEENVSQLPQVGQKGTSGGEYRIIEAIELEMKIETDFEEAKGKSEYKVLADNLRHEIAESLNQNGINIKSELPSDVIMEYDDPQFSIESVARENNKTNPELQGDKSDKTLPLLRQSLVTKELVTEGINPPPAHIADRSSTSASAQSPLLVTQNTTVKPSENIKDKCRNFLANLLVLARKEPKSVETNIRNLIQELINAQVEPEEFSDRLGKLLKARPQRQLINFLKNSLPPLLQSLVTKELVIEGINPPPTHIAYRSSTSAPAQPYPLVAQNVTVKPSDNTKEKCRNFLANLLDLSGKEPKSVETNVRKLIQELINAQVEPEEFCDRLERLLNASPQPCLIGFLKKSLPLLRQSLVKKELAIEGINPPPAHIAVRSSTSASAQSPLLVTQNFTDEVQRQRTQQPNSELATESLVVPPEVTKKIIIDDTETRDEPAVSGQLKRRFTSTILKQTPSISPPSLTDDILNNDNQRRRSLSPNNAAGGSTAAQPVHPALVGQARRHRHFRRRGRGGTPRRLLRQPYVTCLDVEWRQLRLQQHQDEMELRREENRIRIMEIESQKIWQELGNRTLNLLDKVVTKYFKD